jgi:hypothetical protein
MTANDAGRTLLRSVRALAIGVFAFLCLTALRMRLPPAISANATLGLLLTMLMYLLPAASVGALTRQRRVLHGIIFGLLTAGVVWMEMPLQRAALKLPDITSLALLLTLFSLAVCVAGVQAGACLVRRFSPRS